MDKLEIKLISKPGKSKVLIHYDILVDGEYWGKTIESQISVDLCWRIYQQQPTGLSSIRINKAQWYSSGEDKFKDKQEVIDYVTSSPTCYKENSNIFIDNSMQPKKIREDTNIHPQNARHGKPKSNNNNHKRRNSRK